MNKQDIIGLAKSLLDSPYNEENLLKISEKNPKKFFNNLSSLDERQIKEILKLHPDYANKFSDGWHALHYASTLNNHFIVEEFMQGAIKQGLTSLPSTTKSKKGITENVGMLNFCAANNCDKSYLRILTYLSNPEEQDFEMTFKYALYYNSNKIIPIIQKIVGNEASQKIMYDFFVNKRKNEDGKLIDRLRITLKNKFKENPKKLEDYNIDFHYKEEGKKNYFTATLNMINNSVYDYTENREGLELIKNYIGFFLEKGFDFDSPDRQGVSPRKYIEEIINNLEIGWGKELLEQYVSEMEVKSLDNKLPKKKGIEPKKIKI